jgi:hypothetical protein
MTHWSMEPRIGSALLRKENRRIRVTRLRVLPAGLFCALSAHIGDGGEAAHASCDYDEFLFGVGRESAQRLFPSLFQN